MQFFLNHYYITLVLAVVIANYTIKKLTKAKYSPLTRLLLLCFSLIGQACSPFSGPVDKEVSDSYYYSSSKDKICYSPMGNWFELGNTKMNADVETFQVIARDFGRDKAHLYFKYHSIDNEADRESFHVKGFVCFDKEHVYIPYDYTSFRFDNQKNDEGHLMTIKHANPKTFKKVDDDWSKDDKHYFYYYQPVDVDYETFEIINKNIVSDKNMVYLKKQYELLESYIDPATVEKIDSRYVKDKSHVYDFQEYIDGKVADSLKAFPYEKGDEIRLLNKDYLVVGNTVIYDGFEIEEADAQTFRPLSKPAYSKDQSHIFYLGKVVKDADPTSFEVFDYQVYAKDKDNVYFAGKVLKAADVATFGPVGQESLLYRDKNHTYRGDEIVKD